MNDNVILVVALCAAAAGLFLLFLAREETVTRPVLSGTVLDVRGSTAVIQTNVTLRVRNVSRGEKVSVPVFWDGTHFVATREP
jgi:uncharacterized membrane protein HdeD (DUF308 family)